MNYVDFGLLFLRVGIGLLSIIHGYPKIISGVQGWHNIGVTFMSPLGIKFFPTIWGLLAASAEFFGGIMLVLGLGTQIASFFLTIAMVVAALWHIQKGDDFKIYSFALTLIIVFVTFMIIGSGPYSLDHLIFKK